VTSRHKVFIVTLGCAKNTADTDNLTRLLKARGCLIAANPEEADAIIVHTCSFIEAAKKQSIEAILQAGGIKTGKQKLFATGCLIQQHGAELFKEMPEVDAFLGTGQLAQIPGLLEKPRNRFINRARPGGFMDAPRQSKNADFGVWSSELGISNKNNLLPHSAFHIPQFPKASAYLRLSEGCSHPCSFCVIPRIRGAVQSRSEDAILREARELAEHGVEEFSVIAQDTGDWGRDTRSRNRLPELLRAIGKIPGVRWVRLMYMHPASFSDDLLEVFAEQPDKFPYLDMPLQHIDSQILSRMRRKIDEKNTRLLIERVRKRAPDLSLRTTLLAGFPGETAAQFRRLVEFVKEGHFDYLGAFAYSREEGTVAGRMPGQISQKVKQERQTTLTDAYYDTAHTRAQKRIGKAEIILIEETEGNEVLGRTRREAPEIDAIVRLPQKAARRGRFVTAKLTGYDAFEYTAQPL
jgi:ribosomal protein S12 methylthiotransferase